MKPRLSLLLVLALLISVLPGNTLAQQSPSITISIPLPGETTSFVEVVVVGTGAGLPENNVVVQARDSQGNVLTESNATVAADLGSSGEWRTTLQLGVAPGTPGQIVAFAPSPADGSILASASVDVTFGSDVMPTVEPVTPTPELPMPTVEPVTPTPELPMPTVEPVTPTPVLPMPTVEPVTPTPELPMPTVEPVTPTPVLPMPTVEPVTPTPAPRPALNITVPRSGETVSPVEIVVIGLGTALPENNVVVRALDTRGAVLDEEVATVNAPLGGSGEWRVILRPNAEPGSQGRIVALSPSPVGGNAAETSINVRYGSAPPTPTPPQPALRISIPLEGEVVSPYEVVVVGQGTALPENNVVVRALDSSGRILAEQATSYSAPVGGTGEWRATLRPNVAPGTVGAILAFSPSPADGSILAQASVNVTYGTAAPPARPSVVIEQPREGSLVNTSGGLVVRGKAAGVFEGNVIVRVRDAANRTIAQQATTASNGAWSTTFSFLIASGTPGSIYAFSPSPVDGSIMADDLVRVTFASDCRVRSDWPVYTVQPGDTLYSIASRTGSTVSELVWANCLPNPSLIAVGQPLYVPRLPGQSEPVAPPAITIAGPEADATLEGNVPFVITGTATQVLSSTVFVRVLDLSGQVLAETPVDQTEAPDEAGQWDWSAEVVAPDMAPGTRATIFAYALSPNDGSILVATAQPALFGEDNQRAYITISDPLPYAQVGGKQKVAVSGMGRGLFENNVVVRALDDQGKVLAEVPATLDAEEVGGEGRWSVELPVDAVARGRLVAFHENAADGSIMAEAAIDVQFGDLASQKTYAQIVYPLPGTVFTNQTPYVAVTGYAGGLPDDTVYVLLQDEFGDIIQLLPVEVDARTGFWWFVARPDLTIEADNVFTVRVVGTSSFSGRPVTSDRIQVRTQAADSLVTGQVSYLVRSALPDDAVVKVSIVNASLADAPPDVAVIGRQTIPTYGRQVPIPFAVGFNSLDVDERFTYKLVVRIEDGQGNLLFINPGSDPVITQGNPTSGVEILVDPV